MDFSVLAKTATKSHMKDYLISTNRPVKGHFSCLSTLAKSPNAHPDNNPSMNYNPHNGTVHCHQCGLTLDLLDLIGIDYQTDDKSTQMTIAKNLFPDISKLDDHQGQPQTAKKSKQKGHALEWNDTIKTSPRSEPNIITAEEYLNNETRSESQIQLDSSFFEISAKNPERFKAWKQRGITSVVIDEYQLGYESNYPHFRQTANYNGFNAEVLTIPYLDKAGSGVLRNLTAGIEKKDRYDTKGPKQLYNTKSIYDESDDYLFIVEGEIDGLSCAEVSFDNFISLGSTANVQQFINLLNQNNVPGKILILLLDNDKAGDTATERIVQALENQSKYYVYVPQGFYPLGVKDMNDFLLMDRKRLFDTLLETAKDARKQREADRKEQTENYQTETSILGFIDQFKNDLGKIDTTPIYPTGFSLTDDYFFNGGLHGQSLIIIGALSSSGKTTLIHQMADNIAESGHDVMIFSLEMSRSELLAKSISRLTYKKVYEDDLMPELAKTVFGVMDGQRYSKYSQEDIDIIYHAVQKYKICIAPHMYVFEGMGDVTVIPAGYNQLSIRERVEHHVNITGRKPVVIVDYLQILAPTNPRATDKQNTDKNVLELKRIARDYNLPVIAISSMNRDSYNKPISMESFKESGAVEYSSDVLLGLQFSKQSSNEKGFDVKEEKAKNPRQMELTLLKSRNGQMTLTSIYYEYNSKFNHFKETGLIAPHEDKDKDESDQDNRAREMRDKLNRR